MVVPEQTGNLLGTVAAIGKLIDIGEADHRRLLRDAQRKHPFVPLVVRANLTWEEMARIERGRIARTACATRNGSRMRFSRLPP